MKSGIIVKWFRREGETVKKGSDLLEVETEKVTYTIKSPTSGNLLKILASEMSEIPVNRTIAFIGEGKKLSYAKTALSLSTKKRGRK